MNRIWEDYDTSRDGYLTLEESREFIRDSFGNASTRVFSDEDVNTLFARIDTDSDGRINKGEMASFLLQLSKFWLMAQQYLQSKAPDLNFKQVLGNDTINLARKFLYLKTVSTLF